MSPAMKNGVLFGIIVIGGAIAVWRFTSTSREESMPDTAATTTEWICDKCGLIIHLTAKQRDDMRKDPNKTRYGAEYDAKQTVFKCEKCGTFSVVRARRCSVHNVWFYPRDSNGTPSNCPQCPKDGG